MRSGGCVPLSFLVWVEEILGRKTWDALSRRYEDLCGNQPVGRVHHRWRGGRCDDSARTRRKILISTQTPTRTRRSCRVSWASTSGRRSPRASARANETTPAPWRTRRRPRGRPSGSSRAARGRWTRSVVRCNITRLTVLSGPRGILLWLRSKSRGFRTQTRAKPLAKPSLPPRWTRRPGSAPPPRRTTKGVARFDGSLPKACRRDETLGHPATDHKQRAASSCHSSPTRSPRAARATCCPR